MFDHHCNLEAAASLTQSYGEERAQQLTLPGLQTIIYLGGMDNTRRGKTLTETWAAACVDGWRMPSHLPSAGPQ